MILKKMIKSNYYHCRNLESVVFGEVKAIPEYSDKDLKGAYHWLEKEVGFYPLFCAVGTTDEDIRMTGYQDNWRVKVSFDEYRKKGCFPNQVLFRFKNVDGVFMDYDAWHLVLNSTRNNYEMSDYEKKLIFKPSWQKSKWLMKAKEKPHTVQLVTSKLYLHKADKISVRNEITKKELLINNKFIYSPDRIEYNFINQFSKKIDDNSIFITYFMLYQLINYNITYKDIIIY